MGKKVKFMDKQLSNLHRAGRWLAVYTPAKERDATQKQEFSLSVISHGVSPRPLQSW